MVIATNWCNNSHRMEKLVVLLTGKYIPKTIEINIADNLVKAKNVIIQGGAF
jgi:hypothetical protein